MRLGMLSGVAVLLAVTPALLLGQETQPAAAPVAEAVLAVVTVMTYDADAEPVSQGSGFFVSSDGLLVTCYHVISGAVSAEIVLADGTSIPVTGMCEALPGKDLALLKVDMADAAFLSIAEQEAAAGEKVVAIGSPQGLANTLSDGIVSGYRAQEDGPTLLQTSAPTSAGSSGGPVVNSAGEVLGVTTSTWRTGNDLNFAVPARYVRGLLLIAEEPGPLPADPKSDVTAAGPTDSDDSYLTRAEIIAQLPKSLSPFTLDDKGTQQGWTANNVRLVTIWGQENVVGRRVSFVAPEGATIRAQLIGGDDTSVRLNFKMTADGLLPGLCEIDATLDAETVAILVAREEDEALRIVGTVAEFGCYISGAGTTGGLARPEDVGFSLTLEDCKIGQPLSPDEDEDYEEEGVATPEPEPVDDETVAGRILRAAELYRAGEMPEREREKLMAIITLYPETEAATKARERIEQMDAEPQDAAADDAGADE